MSDNKAEAIRSNTRRSMAGQRQILQEKGFIQVSLFIDPADRAAVMAYDKKGAVNRPLGRKPIEISGEDTKKEYLRIKKRESRARKKAQSQGI